MAETLRKLKELGVRYFLNAEDAVNDLEKRKAADADKYATWKVFEYDLPEPDGRTIYGCTGSAGVLGWTLAQHFGFSGSIYGEKNRKQKPADEQLLAMSDDEKYATIAKAMMLPIEQVRAMFTAPLSEPVAPAGSTGSQPAPTGKGGRKGS
jgi:hypothetical protein